MAAQRIVEPGDFVEISIRTNSALEFYLVTGPHPDDAVNDPELPQRGTDHPTIPNCPVDVIRRISILSDVATYASIVAVFYRRVPLGFLGPRRASRFITNRIPIALPAWSVLVNAGSAIWYVHDFAYPFYRNEVIRVFRHSDSGLQIEAIMAFFHRNADKIYEIDGVPYQLTNVVPVYDQFGNDDIETYFRTLAPIADIPADSLGFEHVHLDGLNYLDTWTTEWDDGVPVVVPVRAERIFGPGEVPIPWF